MFKQRNVQLMVSGIEHFLKDRNNERKAVLQSLEIYQQYVPSEYASLGEAFYENEVRINSKKWGNDAPPLTPEALNDLYEFYSGLPARSDDGKVNKKDFQPSKSTLKGFLRETTFNEAIVELVDNAIDNFVESRQDQYPQTILDFKIMIKEPGPGYPDGAIVIRENSGGVPPDKRIALIRLGQTTREGSLSIGTWGWGAKLAYHTLGSDIEIFTRHWKLDLPIGYWYPSDWLKQPMPEPRDPDLFEGSWYNWAPNDCKISPESLKNIQKGETITIVHMPNPKFFSQGVNVLVSDLKNMLGIAFAEKAFELRQSFGGGSVPFRIEIKSNTEDIVNFGPSVEQQVIDNCSFFPGFEPIMVKCKWSLNNGENLDGIIYAGITPEGETKIPNATLTPGSSWKSQGIYMWGNGRPFLEHINGLPEASDTFVYSKKFFSAELGPPNLKGTEYNFKFQKPKIDRGNLLHIWVKFSSRNSQSIPWNSPRKMRFASVGNDFKTLIEKDIWDISVGYAHLSNKIKRDYVKPFTQKWNSLNNIEKMKLLFPERLIDRAGYPISGVSYDENILSLMNTPAKDLISYQVRPRILNMNLDQFRKGRAFDQIPSRSNRLISEIISRSIAVENPECDNATLKEFWEPLLRRGTP